MPVTTRRQAARQSALDNPELDDNSEIDSTMADDNVIYQKAYNRTIDAPTVVTPSAAATVLAINQLNLIALCSPWIKMYGQFKGHSDSGIGAKKFIAKFKQLVKNIFNPVSDVNVDDILKEHKISDNIPAFPKEVNEVIFDILSNVCEGEAYDIVDPYTVADDDTSIDQDGRRAYFALLREYFPTSNNCCKVAESQLRDFKFSINKSETAAHRTQFRKLIFDLGEARGSQLTKLEKWNALTDAISGDEFANLRQILNFQPESKERDIDWLLNAITDYIADSNVASKSNDKGVAFGVHLHGLATNPPSSPPIDNLEEKINNLVNARLAAITNTAMTKPRVNANKSKNKEDTRTRREKYFDGPPPRDCKYCPGQLHWSRDCPRLAELELSAATVTAPAKSVKPQLAAIAPSSTSSSKGFAFGMNAKPKKQSTAARGVGLLHQVTKTAIGNPTLWLMSTLTGRVWLNAITIACILATFAMTSSASARNILAAVTTPKVVVNAPFQVDTAASDHVSGTFSLFRDFDKTTAKDFDVVHGESVHSLGSGDIDMIASDVNGNWHKLTLKDVHYIPGQAMNLISVSKAFENEGVQNPDFINLEWVINDTTFKLTRSNGTFALDAQPSASSL